jgi:hypothetical protein
MIATFRVERRWKGAPGKVVRVRTCGTQTSVCTCGTDFRLGASLVVFAVGNPLSTGSCQRTTEYHKVENEPDMKWLGAEELVRALDALAKRRTVR